MYSIWRACERFGLIPDDIHTRWSDNSVEAQANLLAYDEIRGHEEFEKHCDVLKTLGAKASIL